MTKKLISLEISVGLLERIKQEAEKQELSMSALIRAAIRTYLKEQHE